MCDTGSWRQVFCKWTGMLKSMPFLFGKSSSSIEGTGSGGTMNSSFRMMLGGIEPLSVIVCLVSVLVTVNFLPFVWYFIKFCFKAIKKADEEEPQQYRQRRETIHEGLHQDMNRQLQHQLDQNESLQETEGEVMDEQLHRHPIMVDSCVQVHPRNFPRRHVSLMSLRHARTHGVTPQASYFHLHQGAAGDTARPRYGPSSMRESESAWPPHYDATNYSCHRVSSNCTWIRYPHYSPHQAPGVMPTPRLTRNPVEVTESRASYFKDELTQTSPNDFIQALQKCRVVRQTRSGAIYSVYF